MAILDKGEPEAVAVAQPLGWTARDKATKRWLFWGDPAYTVVVMPTREMLIAYMQEFEVPSDSYEFFRVAALLEVEEYKPH